MNIDTKHNITYVYSVIHLIFGKCKCVNLYGKNTSSRLSFEIQPAYDAFEKRILLQKLGQVKLCCSFECGNFL